MGTVELSDRYREMNDNVYTCDLSRLLKRSRAGMFQTWKIGTS